MGKAERMGKGIWEPLGKEAQGNEGGGREYRIQCTREVQATNLKRGDGINEEFMEEAESQGAGKTHNCPCLLLCFLTGLFLSESLADKGSGAGKILMNNCNWGGTFSSCRLPKSRV